MRRYRRWRSPATHNDDVLQNKAYGDKWSAFYEGAVEEFAIQGSEVMTKMLYTLRERTNGNEVMLTSNRLQYMSNADKLNVSSQMLDRGIMSINDVREIWNLPPIDGGDTRIIRGEYYSADEKITEARFGQMEGRLGGAVQTTTGALEEVRHCPSCGEILRSDDRFCSRCGEEVSWV